MYGAQKNEERGKLVRIRILEKIGSGYTIEDKLSQNL